MTPTPITASRCPIRIAGSRTTSAETAAWVEAQNAVTFAYLEQIPFCALLKARLQELYYPRYLQPSRAAQAKSQL